MATRRTGGYAIHLDDGALGRYSADLSIYTGGMMAFAYKNARIPSAEELAVLEAVARDIERLIAKKKAIAAKKSRNCVTEEKTGRTVQRPTR